MSESEILYFGQSISKTGYGRISQRGKNKTYAWCAVPKIVALSKLQYFMIFKVYDKIQLKLVVILSMDNLKIELGRALLTPCYVNNVLWALKYRKLTQTIEATEQKNYCVNKQLLFWFEPPYRVRHSKEYSGLFYNLKICLYKIFLIFA